MKNYRQKIVEVIDENLPSHDYDWPQPESAVVTDLLSLFSEMAREKIEEIRPRLYADIVEILREKGMLFGKHDSADLIIEPFKGIHICKVCNKVYKIKKTNKHDKK